MRFRRAIFASLAPLLSLSALVAALDAQRPSEANPHARNTLASLLLTVAHLVAPEAHSTPVSASSSRPSPRAFLQFSALAHTPLGHSLWMVASLSAAPVFLRIPQRTSLRC